MAFHFSKLNNGSNTMTVQLTFLRLVAHIKTEEQAAQVAIDFKAFSILNDVEPLEC